MFTRLVIPILITLLLDEWALGNVPLSRLWRKGKRRFRRRGERKRWPVGAIVSLVFALLTVFQLFQRSFAPTAHWLFYLYMGLFFFYFLPRTAYAFGCAVAHKAVGALLAVVMLSVEVYGATIGFAKLNVVRLEYASADLPAAFDGYRIVQFSDAHTGMFTGPYSGLLARDVDSINAQQADMVVFTGDLQNMKAEEVAPHADNLRRIEARDGVYSVLGNHDYADYLGIADSLKPSLCRRVVTQEQELGWCLLSNAHRVIRRGGDSIVIAGMENDQESRFYPRRGDIKAALKGVNPRSFVIMAEHDPRSWRDNILPNSGAQLTLCGHTHAMQFEIFGWSPVTWMYREWAGMYYEGRRALNVSRGMGGFLPFRLGATAEINVITLRRLPNRQLVNSSTRK